MNYELWAYFTGLMDSVGEGSKISHSFRLMNYGHISYAKPYKSIILTRHQMCVS